MNTVYFEPVGRLHPSWQYFLRYPPEGYEYVLPRGPWVTFVRWLTRLDIVYYNLGSIGRRLPLSLLKAKLDGALQRPPNGARLTFAVNHVVTRSEPWVVFLEWVPMLTGFDIEVFRQRRHEIEKFLSASNCKRILVWCEQAREALLRNLDCMGFKDKVEILPLAVPPRPVTKDFHDERTRILFVGSSHLPKGLFVRGTSEWYEFIIKGGREVLEAFARLKPKYSDLELVMRARIPHPIRERYASTPGVRFIEGLIPRKELEREFLEADIYVLPGHQVTPFGSILEAMSYELPVITLDVFGNSDFVQDGVTGFLVKPSEKIPYYADDHLVPAWLTARREEFLHSLKATDDRVMADLSDKIALLIEDKGLRRQLGRAARHEIERGRHSIAERNRRLKKVFDEAVS